MKLDLKTWRSERFEDGSGCEVVVGGQSACRWLKHPGLTAGPRAPDDIIAHKRQDDSGFL